MDAEEQTYRELQQHLDEHPIGFPATRSGAEIRILKRFFSPEEARLAMHLSHQPRSIERICETVKESGMAPSDVDAMLNGMMKNGVIGRIEREGAHYFYNLPFVVGMFEGQLNRLTPEFLREVEEYTSDRAFGLNSLSTKVPQMRTIPVGKSITVDHHVTTYDHLTEIINRTDGPIVINECLCRKVAAMKGNPCQKTSRAETCMAFGDIAKNCAEAGVGRVISREEALDIARENEADGLVLQPSNTQEIEFVCACCGCCCGMLRVHKMLPRPVDFWATNYYASVDTETCTGCGLCVERCQVNALAIDEGHSVSSINLARCIGCGNCVSSCPLQALSLVKKEKEVVPPLDTQDLYRVIMANKKGKLGRIKLAARLTLRK
jgi:ferredoxin